MSIRSRALLGTAVICIATPGYGQSTTTQQDRAQTSETAASTQQDSAQSAETAASTQQGAAQPSEAAAPQEGGIAEIIVTAQRREENLQRVPISVSAFTSEEIRARGLTDLSRLEGLVPGFTFGRSGVEARPAIRGVRTENVGINADTTIGFFIDGIYQSRTSQGTLGFVDLERVEVQRGPQGTLYGRNTFGGNISLVTAQPRLSVFELGTDVTIGSNNLVRATAFGNAPLGDTLALRLVAGYEKSDGFVKNVRLDDNDLFDADDRYLRCCSSPTIDLR
jgi:iron complex outermembrane receptor protein